MEQKENRYADMYNLPHHQSDHHPHMPMIERAAQFSPFAALTGYGDEIRETARITEARKELTEEEKLLVNTELQTVGRLLKEKRQPKVAISWFQADLRKEGGSYRQAEVCVRKLETDAGSLKLEDGTSIPFVDIVKLTVIG